jgi:hypothetical protein
MSVSFEYVSDTERWLYSIVYTERAFPPPETLGSTCVCI